MSIDPLFSFTAMSTEGKEKAVAIAEYFTARTWDFVDDPDDFIEAIRCYEKAKQSLQAGGADSEKIADIDKAIHYCELLRAGYQDALAAQDDFLPDRGTRETYDPNIWEEVAGGLIRKSDYFSRAEQIEDDREPRRQQQDGGF